SRASKPSPPRSTCRRANPMNWNGARSSVPPRGASLGTSWWKCSSSRGGRLCGGDAHTRHRVRSKLRSPLPRSTPRFVSPIWSESWASCTSKENEHAQIADRHLQSGARHSRLFRVSAGGGGARARIHAEQRLQFELELELELELEFELEFEL